MRAGVVAAIAFGLAPGGGDARADAAPGAALEVHGFVGASWFSPDTSLGDSWAHEQVPRSTALAGARLAYRLLPALAIEAELAMAPAYTGRAGFTEGGRRMYYAPVFGWRAHARLGLPLAGPLALHAVAGLGGMTVASASPFMSSETDPVAYYGPGASLALGSWRVRLDLRHGVMPGRDGLSSTFEVQLGAGIAFGAPPPPRLHPQVARPPVEPEPEPEPEPVSVPVPDPVSPPEPAPVVPAPAPAPAPAPPSQPVAESAAIRAAFSAAATLRFPVASARLPAANARALRPLLDALQADPDLRITITGHPISALARRRAESVKWFLVDAGIPSDRLAIATAPAAGSPPISIERTAP